VLTLFRRDPEAPTLALCTQKQLDQVIGLMSKEEECAYFAK